MTPETPRPHRRRPPIDAVSRSAMTIGAVLLVMAATPTVSHGQVTGGAGPAASAGAPQPTAAAQPPAADPKSMPIATTTTQTKRLQRRLRVRADGQFGARTGSALRRWETRNRLAADGRPDRRVLHKMRIRLTTAQRSSTDRQAATTPSSTPAAEGALQTAIAAAKSRIGDPYSHGGAAPGGFDCSGLVVWALKQAGIRVPRTSFEQARAGTEVPRDQIQPGDLVFFSTAGPGASDVGLAVDGQNVVSATTRGVKIHPTFDEYWGSQYVTARRLR